MKPTHIDIVGRSKSTYMREIAQELGDERFASVVERLPQAPTIVLSGNVTSVGDLNGLIEFLIKRGIRRHEIQVRFPPTTRIDYLARALSQGLAKSGLDFGLDVAERDEGLVRYFITTKSFKAVQAHRKHIIVGPKGSGKSAMLRELVRNSQNALVITPEHYATEVLESLKKGATTSELAAYSTTWKYTLLVEIFKKIVQQRVGEAKALADIRSYLLNHGHLSHDISLFERFTSYLRRITKIKGRIGLVEGELGMDATEELNKLFKMDELLELLPTLQRVLRRTKFEVFLDELDQSWNNSETANGFLVSLLIAAIQLRGISENLHVVVFLRSEIFDLLKPHLAQLDKIRTDIETLHWSLRDLTNLTVTRALDSLDITADIQAEMALYLLFPGAVDNSGLGVFDYLLSRTSLRPREVIQFCNLALQIASDSGGSAITFDSIVQAEEQFSSWKLEYVIAENMFIYPGLDILLERFRGGAKHQARQAIDSLLTEIVLEYSEKSPPPGWCKPGIEPDELLDILYSIEVLGIERPPARSTDSRHIWTQYDFVFSRPNGKPEDSASFLFHPGLWKALDLH